MKQNQSQGMDRLITDGFATFGINNNSMLVKHYRLL